METTRFFTKAHLIKANKIAIKRKYNRAVFEHVLDALPNDKVYPVITKLPHHHKGGRPTETHMRVVVVINEQGQLVTIDCDMSLYRSLPVFAVSGR